MTDSRKDPGNAGQPPQIGDVRNRGRRRLLQAGVSAAPVVMTLASRPVWAIECRTPSGFVSGFASAALTGVCGGGLPAYWLMHAMWPPPFVREDPGATRFNDIFNPDLDGNPTFMAVLGMTGTLQSYIVAAYLNNAQGLVPELILPRTTIEAMWTQVVNNGGFGLGIPGPTLWNTAQVIDYLKSHDGRSHPLVRDGRPRHYPVSPGRSPDGAKPAGALARRVCRCPCVARLGL